MSEAIVRPINKEILGMEGSNNLILQTIPAIGIINKNSFLAGDKTNVFSYSVAPGKTGRLGIFAAKKNNVERAVMVLLPQTAKPEGILICITHGFAQASAVLDKLGWANPLSPEAVKFALLKHIVNRWGAQMLASRKNLALVYILRAKGAKELGPFANDGPFFLDVIKQIADLTNNAFSYGQAEAFTFSSGIYDFNKFIAPVGKLLPVNAVYAIDPVHSLNIINPSGGVRKQYASGTAGPMIAGFEPLGLGRWQKEDRYEIDKNDRFQYLHNHCMPMYCLHLALETT
jgi:hypothetical protein